MDDVNFYPDQWHYHTKGTTVACDDAGAITFTARDDGWYYVYSEDSPGMRYGYLPPKAMRQ